MDRARKAMFTAVLVAIALVPSLLIAVFARNLLSDQDALADRSDRLAAVVDRQGDALESAGLPRDGSDGPQGLPGQNGTDGRAGQDGTDGTDGVDGADGADGLTVQGPQGAQGEPGDDGAPGGAGATGAQGEPGVAGPAGEPGPAGPAGPQGEAGATGATGPPGERGPAPVGIWVPDGLGGQCLATDPDLDGIYACPVIGLAR